jgi:hypothetical protein
MSDLTFNEKRKFEQFLGMKSGYVLNFSDRTFKEFFLDATGLNIFDEKYNYASGSKANRLRAFWQKEENATVGKLMGELLNYSEDTGPVAEVCRLIVERLLKGSTPGTSTQPESQNKQQQAMMAQELSQALRQLKAEFLHLAGRDDRNAAGLALEKLLNRLFTLFGLQPRQPFRVTGEQIDGSFQMDAEIYLLESKWEKHPLAEAPLLVFREKILGKSTFTRGVFIALNGVTTLARDAITRGKAPCFFIMDGHDLLMILTEEMSLTDFLRARMRLLAEEGCVCVPFSELVLIRDTKEI